MVYKKFVKKRGKVFGPYYYESYRVGDTVKKRYLGTKSPDAFSEQKKKKIYKISAFFLMMVLVTLLAWIFYTSFPEIKQVSQTIGKIIFEVLPLQDDKGLEAIEKTPAEQPTEEQQAAEQVPETVEQPIEETAEEKLPSGQEKKEEKTEEKQEQKQEKEEKQEEQSPGQEKKEEQESEEPVEKPAEPEISISEENITEIPENVSISEDRTEQVNITNVTAPEIPENITELNITEVNITKVNVTEINITEINVTEINATNTTATNITIETLQYQATIGKPVKWKKTITPEMPTDENITINLPPTSANITLNKIKNDEISETTALTGMVTDNFDVGRGQKIINFLKKLFFFFTGRAIEESLDEVEVIIQAEQDADKYEIEYLTQAPEAIEQEITSGKKQITISAPDYLHYTNILAYSFLQKEVSSQQAIKLYWLINDTNNTKQEINFDAYDTDNNTLIDYIEWIVPSLSNQSYEIEITILNVHSYPSLYGNWTVEFNTTGIANLTITATYEPNYTQQVTRWHNESENSSLYDLRFIEIKCENEIKQYEWQGENCSQNECSVFISNYSCEETAQEISKVLTAKPHVLKFNFGGEEVYAYNNATAPPDINFTSPTPPNATTTTNTSVIINISITNASDLAQVIWNWNSTNYTFYDNSSLVLMFNFDNISAIDENATKAVDVSKYSNNGTISGAAWNISGKYGSALSFDGTNDYVEILDSSIGNEVEGNNKLTLEAWIKSDDSTGTDLNNIIMKHYSSPDGSFGIFLTSSITYNCDIRFFVINSTSAAEINTQTYENLCDNNWHHVVGLYNSTNLRIYVDGKLDAAQTSFSGNINNTVYPVCIGVSSGQGISTCNEFASAFNGTIDEVRIWNRSLSAAEIQQHYYSNLYKYASDSWQFYSNQTITEPLGSYVYNYSGCAKDISGNENCTETRRLTIQGLAPDINFTSPTPPNATTTTNTSVQINISITNASDLGEMKFNWNSTNYTFYNDSLVLMFNFDNISAIGENATRAVDVSKYSNNGTLINGVAWITFGKYGRALQFDGVNDYVNVSDSASLDIANEITILAWIKYNSTTGEQYIVGRESGYRFRTTNGVLEGVVENASGTFSNPQSGTLTLASNAWYYVAMVYNGSVIKTYINSVEDDSVNYSGTLKAGTLFEIGAVPIGGAMSFFNGTIDEVRIWNRSLSSGEINQSYISNLYKYASDKWAFNSNQTNLTAQNYTYFGCAKDISGNENCTETRTLISQAGADIIKPQINMTYPRNITYNINVSILNYTVSDETGLSRCWFSSNNGLINLTLTCGVNMTGVNSTQGSNNWRIWANDTSGNLNESNVTFVVDTISPDINITYPRNITYAINVSWLNYTVSTDTQSCRFSSNNGLTNQTITCGVNMSGVNSTQGSNTWRIYVNDSANNLNESNVTFIVDTIAPDINITYPQNTSYNYSITILNYTIINSSSCWFSSNNGLINQTITCGTNITGANSSEGSNTWRIFANDSSNNIDESNVTFVVDSIIPSVSITYPANTTYNVNVSWLNYTVSDVGLQSCWYTLNNGASNTSITCGTNATGLTSSEGSNIWKVYANDTVGNVNSASITFSKDTIKPNINLTYPRNISYSINVSWLNYTVNDANLQSCWYSLNNGVTNTSVACGTNLTGLTSSESNNTWLISANDTAGNINISRVTFVKDTIFPIFYGYWDDNTTLAGSGIAYFNVSINFTNGTVFMQINNTNYTATNLTSNIFNVSVNLSNGTYSYYWSAWGNGSLKNYNISEIRSYTITANFASINITLPQNSTILPRGNDSSSYEDDLGYIDNNISIIAKVYDNATISGLQNVNCSFYFNALQIGTNLTNSSGDCILIYDKSSQGFGWHNISVNYTASSLPAGYTSYINNSIATLKLENWTMRIEISNYRNIGGTKYYEDDVAGVNVTLRRDNVLVNVTNLTLIMTNQLDVELKRFILENFTQQGTGIYFTETIVPSTSWLRWKGYAIYNFSIISNLTGIINATSSLHTDVDVDPANALLNVTAVNSTDVVFVNTTISFSRYGSLATYQIYQAIINSSQPWLSRAAALDDRNYEIDIIMPNNHSLKIIRLNVSANETKIKAQVANYTGTLPSSIKNLGNVIASNASVFENTTLYFAKEFQPEQICKCANWNFSSANCDGTWQCLAPASYNMQSNATHFWFNVSNFSGYAGGIGYNSNLTIFDSADSLGGSQTIYTNQNARFYANYTNATNGTAIIGATCNFRENSAGTWSANAAMTYNTSSLLYEYTKSFGSSRTFNWNASCSATNYDSLQATDTITITATAGGGDGGGGGGGGGIITPPPVECTENWQCTDWNICENEQQTRTCTDANACGTTKNKPSESQSCIVGCIENWQCDWAECNENGISYAQNCQDLNNCGTSQNKPDFSACSFDTETQKYITPVEQGRGGTCSAEWQCANWTNCNVAYKIEQALQGQVLTQGMQERTCKDIALCQQSRLEYKTCRFNIPVQMQSVEWCHEKYIEIFDLQQNRIVSRLKQSQIKEISKLDIRLLTTNLTGYCDYCYNNIQDYDETEVDCGGSCLECIEIPFVVYWLDIILRWLKWMLWLLLLLLLLYMLREEYKEHKKNLKEYAKTLEKKTIRDIWALRAERERKMKEFKGKIKEKFFG